MCLATALFFEAGVESHDGMLAVADVILNRVEDSRYPDNVCEVIAEPFAFSYTHDGKSDVMPVSPNAVKAIHVAAEALTGASTGITSTHYVAVYAPEQDWQKAFDFDGRIGLHMFYTNNTPWR